MAIVEQSASSGPESEPALADAPFTAWPDPGAGFRVLDLRSMRWAAGPFRTAAEAVAATDRLNAGVTGADAAGRGVVLVVDDDAAIVEFIAMALEDQGYRVVSAINGAALAVAARERPAVILLDIMMPVMDGVEVSRRLRADPRTSAIPIVVMSAHDRLAAAAGSMDADDQLPKPFLVESLYAKVGRWSVPA